MKEVRKETDTVDFQVHAPVPSKQLLTHAHTVSGSNSNFVPGILSSTSFCEPCRSSAYSEDVRSRRARLLVFRSKK